MIETKRTIEKLLIFTAIIIIVGALLTYSWASLEFERLQIFGWTIIIASWFKMANSIIHHRWPKSNFLITAEFFLGSVVVIASLASNHAIVGLLGAVIVVYSFVILYETNLWVGFVAWGINIITAFAMFIVGIMYMAGSFALVETLLWVLYLRAFSNLFLSFMRVKH